MIQESIKKIISVSFGVLFSFIGFANAYWGNDPYFGLAHQNRGISKAFSGDIDGACNDWNKAVELGVKLPESVASVGCK